MPATQLEQLIFLLLVVISHLDHTLPPFILRMKLVNDVDRILGFYIFNPWDVLQAQENVPVS
jgi:hypothetical protein